MKKLTVLLLIGIAVVFQYCSSSKKTTAASETAPKKIYNYTSDLQSTILANCSPCHIPPRGNMLALDTYASAKTNIDNIITRINMTPGTRGFMPFKHDKLSDSVISIFVKWKADGLLEK